MAPAVDARERSRCGAPRPFEGSRRHRRSTVRSPVSGGPGMSRARRHDLRLSSIWAAKARSLSQSHSHRAGCPSGRGTNQQNERRPASGFQFLVVDDDEIDRPPNRETLSQSHVRNSGPRLAPIPIEGEQGFRAWAPRCSRRPMEDWLRCSSSKYGEYSFVVAPGQRRRSPTELGNEPLTQDTSLNHEVTEIQRQKCGSLRFERLDPDASVGVLRAACGPHSARDPDHHRLQQEIV